MSSILSGGKDRLQQGINVLASTRQGGTLYSQEALRNMSAPRRMEIMRLINSRVIAEDKDLPSDLRADGVTIAMLKGYSDVTSHFAFAEYQSKQGTKEVNEAVSDWQNKADHGLGGMSKDQKRQRLFLLGSALKNAKSASSTEVGMHLAAQMAGIDTSLFPALSGGSIGDPAGGSLEAGLKRANDLEIKEEENYYKSDKGRTEIKGGRNKDTQKAADTLDLMGLGAMTVSVGKVSKELSFLVDALHQARSDIKNNRPSTPTKTGAPGS